jgi:hypothetical protein
MNNVIHPVSGTVGPHDAFGARVTEKKALMRKTFLPWLTVAVSNSPWTSPLGRVQAALDDTQHRARFRNISRYRLFIN